MKKKASVYLWIAGFLIYSLMTITYLLSSKFTLTWNDPLAVGESIGTIGFLTLILCGWYLITRKSFFPTFYFRKYLRRNLFKS